MSKRKRKKEFIGYTTKDWDVVWTIYNTLNLAFMIQKTKNEAVARYSPFLDFKDIRKIKITIEEI